MPENPGWNNWLRQARALLAEILGEQVLRRTLRVTLTDDEGHSLTLELPPDGQTQRTQKSTTIPVGELSTMERRIYEVLLRHGQPATSREVARMTGYSFTTRLMGALRSLRQKRIVILEPDGYQAQGAQPPAEQAEASNA
jgi:hypothetical protein